MAADRFREREKGYEAEYKLNEELRFKATSRRNRLLGLWAAERMGITGDQAAEYAKEVVAADFEKPGDEDVVEKLMDDFKARGITMVEATIREEMVRLYALAVDQLRKEHPKALGTDHSPIGG